MYQITLEYLVNNKLERVIIDTDLDTRIPGEIVIGRDPSNCDFVVVNESNRVSRQHAKIEKSSKDNFLIVKNLTAKRQRPNSVIVDEKKITDKPVKIRVGSQIRLQDLVIDVKEITWNYQESLKERVFGLECINGHRISLDYLGSFCPHCGYSVQSARTIAK